MDSTVLLIGTVPQYFFDNAIVEQIQDVTRIIHSPIKQPGPVLTKDRPWENNPYMTVNGWSVLRDPASGQFRCWYEDWQVDPSEVKRQGVLYCCPATTCYATSSDGLVWDKPAMDYLVQNGQKTNVVFGNSDYLKLESTAVFEDLIDPNPDRRFKMLADHYIVGRQATSSALGAQKEAEVAKTRDGRDGLTDKVQVELLYSRDGLSWKPYDELPRFGQHGNGLGDCYTIYMDVENGVYRMLTRAAGMETIHYDDRRPRTGSFFPPHFPNDWSRMNMRRVFLSESTDLIHWSRPQSIFTPDADEDNIDDSYYGMIQFRLGELYVGFMNVLHQVDNTLDVRLVYSRDGWRWRQLNQRQPWLRTTPGAWDAAMVNLNAPPIAVGDEHFVFYGGAKNHHDWWIVGLKEGLTVPEALNKNEVRYGLGLAKMRKDGFVSIDAGSVREGVLITRALRSDAQQLTINACCGKGGYIRVEATDSDDRVLAGCNREECDVFTGDSTHAKITWKGRSQISHGGALRLRFFMRNASLYSLAFE